jgi:hypothetical protein
MLKEAIEKIEQLSKPQLVTIGVYDYIIDRDGAYTQVKPDLELPEMVSLSSLDAVVTMVKTEAVKMLAAEIPLFVSVPSATKVTVYSAILPPDKRSERINFYEARATDVPGWEASVKLPFDQAAVALQTRFQGGEDREYCLQLLSNITTGAKVTYNDTGVATTVVTQKGVALQQNQTIKPLVRLRPYRTFQEVEQPEGLFLIRIDERGITFTEADGGMWKLTARKTVAAYLAEALEEEIEDGSVKIML